MIRMRSCKSQMKYEEMESTLEITVNVYMDMQRQKTQTGEISVYILVEMVGHHHGCVALILKKGLRHSLMEWKRFSEKLLCTTCKGKLEM